MRYSEIMDDMVPAGWDGTLSRVYWPLMLAPTIRKQHCVVCGRPANNMHHVVWRSWGELHDCHGRKLKKPMVPLCGMGNASGCHKKAHERRVHFRWMPKVLNGDFGQPYVVPGAGHVEFIEFDEPTQYVDAIDADGWRPLL